MKYKLFCYVCKKHLEFEADNKKDAKQRFYGFGHDDTKVDRLAKDIKLSH